MAAEGFEAWRSATFAPQWLEDAKAQAHSTDDGAVRREVLFSVIAAECYLYEWVRDEVVKHDYQALDKCFPRNGERSPSTLKKWRSVPQRFGIHLDPKLTQDGSDFDRLLKLRNGFAHGGVSRPERASDEDVPAQSGWASTVVVDLIRSLHAAARTAPPSWLPPKGG